MVSRSGASWVGLLLCSLLVLQACEARILSEDVPTEPTQAELKKAVHFISKINDTSVDEDILIVFGESCFSKVFSVTCNAWQAACRLFAFLGHVIKSRHAVLCCPCPTTCLCPVSDLESPVFAETAGAEAPADPSSSGAHRRLLQTVTPTSCPANKPPAACTIPTPVTNTRFVWNGPKEFGTQVGQVVQFSIDLGPTLLKRTQLPPNVALNILMGTPVNTNNKLTPTINNGSDIQLGDQSLAEATLDR